MSKTFSLVVPTIGRTKEVRSLLESIRTQTFSLSQIEVIIVDQNKSPILDSIVNEYKEFFAINHCKVNFKGAAKARNFGANLASGKYIHFPDDDSFYNKDTLFKSFDIFENKKNLDAIAVKVLDSNSPKNALLNFPDNSMWVNCFNFYKLTIEFNLFWEKESFFSLDGFDERLGAGTYFGSEESGDLILRALSNNITIMYTPNIFIYHPDKRNPDIEKIYKYALGFGALTRKHLTIRNYCILPYFANYVGKSILGITLYALFGKPYYVKKYYNRLLGTIIGFKNAKNII